MTNATREKLIGLLESGKVPASCPIPFLFTQYLPSYGSEDDWPAWALEVLLLTEEA